MKRILTLATTVLLITGSAFAQDSKKCVKGKSCCDKGGITKKSTDTKNTKATASFKKA